MAVKAQIFQQILTVVKTLTPAQKAKLREELTEKSSDQKKVSGFTELLLKGPVYSKKQIKVIEETRKDIAAWRTKK